MIAFHFDDKLVNCYACLSWYVPYYSLLYRLEHLDWITREGGCLEVIREYQAQGKIKWVGFSSHGSTDVITKAIETGIFDYVNLHYHVSCSNLNVLWCTVTTTLCCTAL